MTMRLTIKNDDTSRTARATYVDAGTTPGSTDIPPGETREFWIFDTRSLKVEELATTDAPAPTAPTGG